MTGVDIDYGFSNVSKMQDRICEEINQSIISEDTIFRRLKHIEDQLNKTLTNFALL